MNKKIFYIKNLKYSHVIYNLNLFFLEFKNCNKLLNQCLKNVECDKSISEASCLQFKKRFQLVPFLKQISIAIFYINHNSNKL